MSDQVSSPAAELEKWYTLLMFWKTPVIVPTWDKHHVIAEVFSLNLGLLENNYVGLEDLKHGLKGSFVSPWLVTEGIADAIDIPSGDSKTHL